MREKTNSRTRRSLRMYRRLRHNQEGVSPVVATLILILIAVAAAAALYLWLINFQKGATNNIGNGGVQPTLSVGGSTTVFPLSELAIKWFEQNNSNIRVADQQGGSVAGVLAVCSGQLDIGAASSSFSAAQLATDGCPSSAVQTVIGLDGLTVIMSKTNTVNSWASGLTVGTAPTLPYIAAGTVHITAGTEPLLSFNATTMEAIYIAAGDGGNLASLTSGAAGYAFPTYLPAPASTGFTWNQIPFPAGCTTGTATAATVACQLPTNTNRISVYDRQDNSGTEQGFVNKVLGIGACGTDNQLESCNIQVTHEVGNPALLSAVAGDPNGLGFNGFGFASAPSSGVTIFAYLGSGQTLAQLPSTTSVKAAFHGLTGNAIYTPWRPLEYVTTSTPTGESAAYITFVTGSQVNQDLCTATGYISLYAS